MKKTFTRDYLIDELNLPYEHIEKRIVDRGRWSLIYEIVFQDKDGKYYQTMYSEGATENQYEEPWEYENVLECEEVEQREVISMKWMPVD